MRDKDRIDAVLRILKETRPLDSDLRLGQLIVNAIRPNVPVPEIFYAEDDALVEGLRVYAKRMRDAVGDRDSDDPPN